MDPGGARAWAEVQPKQRPWAGGNTACSGNSQEASSGWRLVIKGDGRRQGQRSRRLDLKGRPGPPGLRLSIRVRPEPWWGSQRPYASAAHFPFSFCSPQFRSSDKCEFKHLLCLGPFLGAGHTEADGKPNPAYVFGALQATSPHGETPGAWRLSCRTGNQGFEELQSCLRTKVGSAGRREPTPAGPPTGGLSPGPEDVFFPPEAGLALLPGTGRDGTEGAARLGGDSQLMVMPSSTPRLLGSFTWKVPLLGMTDSGYKQRWTRVRPSPTILGQLGGNPTVFTVPTPSGFLHLMDEKTESTDWPKTTNPPGQSGIGDWNPDLMTASQGSPEPGPTQLGSSDDFLSTYYVPGLRWTFSRDLSPLTQATSPAVTGF